MVFKGHFVSLGKKKFQVWTFVALNGVQGVPALPFLWIDDPPWHQKPWFVEHFGLLWPNGTICQSVSCHKPSPVIIRLVTQANPGCLVDAKPFWHL